MQTATDQMMAKHDEDRQRRMFEDMIEHFTKRFRPADPYEAAEFDRLLFSLTRQIYQDAQKPVLDRITQIAMAASHLSPLRLGADDLHELKRR